jgi:branched-chain amino acid transport system ATP-binding protein
VFDLFPRLQERRDQKAGTMSGGEQQMCAIGRALMARPKLLLLDEPSLGLAPIFVERIFDIIRQINEQGTSILLVEQNALMALDAARRGYVLETGRIVLADDAQKLKSNEEVRKTYLGES